MFIFVEAVLRTGLFLRAIVLAVIGHPQALATRLIVKGVRKGADRERRMNGSLSRTFTGRKRYPRLPF